MIYWAQIKKVQPRSSRRDLWKVWPASSTGTKYKSKKWKMLYLHAKIKRNKKKMRQQQSDCDSADGDMCSTRSWPDGQGLTNWLLPLTALVDSSTGTWDKGRWRWWWHALWQKDRMGNMTDCCRILIGNEIMKFKSSEIFIFLDIYSKKSTLLD